MVELSKLEKNFPKTYEKHYHMFWKSAQFDYMAHDVIILYDSIPLKHRIYMISKVVSNHSVLNYKPSYIYGIFLKEKVPEYLKKKIYFNILANGDGNFRAIPDEYLTEKNIIRAVKKNLLLANIPKKYLTKKICYVSCRKYLYQIEDGPKKYIKSILPKLILNDNKILKFIDAKYLTEKFLIKLINKYWCVHNFSEHSADVNKLLGYVPSHLITPKIKQHIENGPQTYMLK